jgi:hypothetical protein
MSSFYGALKTALVVISVLGQLIDRFLKDPADAAACFELLKSFLRKR